MAPSAKTMPVYYDELLIAEHVKFAENKTAGRRVANFFINQRVDGHRGFIVVIRHSFVMSPIRWHRKKDLGMKQRPPAVVPAGPAVRYVALWA